MSVSDALDHSEHLFVYGTLAPGKENAHFLAGLEGAWQPAIVNGYKFKTTWGVHKGHPGFHPDPNGPELVGLVFSSPDLPVHWDGLDDFEGADYKRVLIDAKLQSGEVLQVYVYCTLIRA